MQTGHVIEASPETDVDLPKATPRAEKPAGDDASSQDRQRERRNQRDGRRDSQRDGQRNRNRNRRREEEHIPESELEVREGIIDILPEGYGFLRVTGYKSGENDVYVSANQVRKFRCPQR